MTCKQNNVTSVPFGGAIIGTLVAGNLAAV